MNGDKQPGRPLGESLNMVSVNPIMSYFELKLFILAYVKPCLRKGITEVKHSNFSIWLKLDHNTLGLKRKIYLGFCYTTPYKKKDISELAFSELESEIQYFKSKGEIFTI
jgi:hypothetical protein